LNPATVPTTFAPRLDILPAAQLRVWPELAQTPASFTLYGGTAIALRLGHRQSADFGFFAWQSFQPQALLASVPYLRDATVRQSQPNTLTCSVERGAPVLISFFGGLSLGQVAEPELAGDSRLAVASLLDLAGTKAAVVTQRAEIRDYLDVHALLTLARIELPEMLAAARVIYGPQFNPLVALKALAYHDDLVLRDLPFALRRDLAAAIKLTDPTRLPALHAVRQYEDP
jgi:hypothetical protein